MWASSLPLASPKSVGNVWCVDKNADRIEQLKGRRVPIYEPRLDERRRTALSSGPREARLDDDKNGANGGLAFAIGDDSAFVGPADVSTRHGSAERH